MIKAIVFDIGGVLLDLDLEICKKSFRERIGFETIDEYIDTYCQKGFWGDFESGVIDSQGFIDKCIENSRPGTTPQDVVSCFNDFLIGVDKEKVDYLKDLSTRYPLYILSNNNPIAMKKIRSFFLENGADMDDIFTGMFLSYEMKVMKPSGEIFLRMIDSIGLAPQEILFVDDSGRNIEAAKKYGISTLYYKLQTDLAEAVQGALVL